MEETAQPTSPVPPIQPLPQALDPAIVELITGLEKQLISSMDATVEYLQSSHQAGSLDKVTLNEKINQVLGFAQAGLLIHTLPILLNAPTIKFSLETAELFKKLQAIAEVIKVLWKEKTMQAIDRRAAQILEQIEAKEQQIKRQIAKKQQAISQVMQAKKHF